MIRNIWLRIAALLALAVIPIVLLQLKLQQEGIQVIYELADRTDVRVTLDKFLSQLREDAKADPSQEKEYRRRFEEASLSKRSLEEFFLARDSIDRDIRLQTIAFSAIVLLASLLGSFIISRGIVKRVQVLIEEKERAAAKLRDLSALQNWQNVARILVHELRAPMTPIKLVATDLDYKYKTLSADKFSIYLADAQKLVNEQVEAIEAMVEGFTRFGKLPDPSLQKLSLPDFLNEYAARYGGSFAEGTTLTSVSAPAPIFIKADPKLLRDLLFNICKNAVEANDGKTQITLTTRVDSHSVSLFIHNTGKVIPAELSHTLFDPYVSTKASSSAINMGLGLAISRKIALDHGGDLHLVSGTAGGGVTFSLELPLAP